MTLEQMVPMMAIALGLAVLLILAISIAFIRSEIQRKGCHSELELLRVATEPLWKYQEVEDATAEAEHIKRNAELSAEQTINNARLDAANIVQKAAIESQELIRAADVKANQLKAVAKDERVRAGESLIAANNKIEQLLQDAKVTAGNIIAHSKKESSEIYKRSQERVDKAKDKSEQLLANAHATANEIIEQAKLEAHQVAGAAFEAKEHADKYESIVVAMKNAIEGYGDEYIIPNCGVLDDLAEDFEHKEAGQRLKNCRSVTKSMVIADKAAECDYVENRRKETAIRFVLDAFNGKVDSVLSKVKRDNYGKLKQQIIDAYSLVNAHGEAFRNARITETYLHARLNELKWAVATEELKQQEREEQQEIKAQIREEEKARKEYEATQRAAEKEERMLEKAMEKARKELEKANEQERAKYEAQLAELQEKWEEAEKRNQRAISMAQQTKRGHVYIISNIGSFGESVFKVGMTRRLEPMDRVKELGDASVPFNFDVHAMIFSEDAPKLENELHKRFNHCRMNRINLRREFFRVSLGDLKTAIDELDIEVHWTMKAEAEQYRESLAIQQRELDSLSYISSDTAS